MKTKLFSPRHKEIKHAEAAKKYISFAWKENETYYKYPFASFAWKKRSLAKTQRNKHAEAAKWISSLRSLREIKKVSRQDV